MVLRLLGFESACGCCLLWLSTSAKRTIDRRCPLMQHAAIVHCDIYLCWFHFHLYILDTAGVSRHNQRRSVPKEKRDQTPLFQTSIPPILQKCREKTIEPSPSSSISCWAFFSCVLQSQCVYYTTGSTLQTNQLLVAPLAESRTVIDPVLLPQLVGLCCRRSVLWLLDARLSVPGVGCVALGPRGSGVLRGLLVSLEGSVVLGFLADSIMLQCLPGILLGSVELPVVVHVVLRCVWGVLVDHVVLRKRLGIQVH